MLCPGKQNSPLRDRGRLQNSLNIVRSHSYPVNESEILGTSQGKQHTGKIRQVYGKRPAAGRVLLGFEPKQRPQWSVCVRPCCITCSGKSELKKSANLYTLSGEVAPLNTVGLLLGLCWNFPCFFGCLSWTPWCYVLLGVLLSGCTVDLTSCLF